MSPRPAKLDRSRHGLKIRRTYGHSAGAILVLLSGSVTAACRLDPGAADPIVHAADAEARTALTTGGPVVGVASSAGQVFLGIPYAAPPIGPLRWRAPQPPQRWTEPRPASKLGESCLQDLGLDAQTGKAGTGPFIGSEDCLTLNVYAPPDAAAGQHRPVMVWIHGGAFVLGTSGQYDPSLLAARTGNLVVTFNYRLGALGFLAHPALRGEPGEGAFALLDQQAALRWVGHNIGGFGGDPGNVTLFGQSAGAWSACYQMASPGASGLFGRAILQSGACITPETSIPALEAEAGGQRLAAELGCGEADPMACLRRKPAEEVLRGLPSRRGVVGPNSWSPAFGLDVLPLAPRVAFESSRFNRVPVIDGTNQDEGRLFTYLRGYAGDLWTEGSYRSIIEAMFGARAPAILAEYPASTFRSPGLAYGAVLTDSLFACAALTLDRLLSRRVPVFAYEFDDPDAPFSLPSMPWSGSLGSFHAAEIASVFGRPWILADPADFSPAQSRLSATIQDYWGRFARSGAPDPGPASTWPRFLGGEGPIRLLSPGGADRAVGFAERHRCGFWAGLGY